MLKAIARAMARAKGSPKAVDAGAAVDREAWEAWSEEEMRKTEAWLRGGLGLSRRRTALDDR